MKRRWLFADQLGPHFLDSADQPVLLIESKALFARRSLADWFTELDADGTVEARCLSEVLRGVREHGWVHHIPRLMVLGNYALQRGWSPQELTDWFHRSFVDGYDWVMVALLRTE
jgi:deoxyribodipyrimidine photolyase-related protein